MLAALRRERRHPLGGFYESGPGDELLLSNPHMHLLEAALAWLGADPRPLWRELAQELAELCVSRFADPKTSAITEYFGTDWTPKSGERGRVIEPGHQFEWAWLLTSWRGFGGAIDLSFIRGLYEVGDRQGLDSAHKLAVNKLWIGGEVKDGGARLWAQCERLKAALAMARLWPQEWATHEASAFDAWRAMQLFVYPENPGLFRDKRRADGSFADESALASSLYHIVCALSKLFRYIDDAQQNASLVSR